MSRLRLARLVVSGLKHWSGLADSLYRLWLASGEYEGWARRQLLNPAGEVHEFGLELVRRLNRDEPTRYWWFQDATRPRFRPLSRCPRCSEALFMMQRGRECRQCLIYAEP
ncbi:MAG: hypothetical protein AAB074_07110 [Planctomycetota bacterium]